MIKFEFKKFLEGGWFADETVTKYRRQPKNSDAETAYEKSKDGTKKGISLPKPPEPNQG